MKKYIIATITVLFVLLGQPTIGQDLPALSPKEEHPQALFVTLNLLEQYHYNKLQLSDSLSSVIYDNYISSLDPTKSYFLKADIDYFEKYRYQLDDDLRGSNLDIGYQIFTIYRERAMDRYDRIPELLEEEFDYTKDEYYETDFEKAKWVNTREELDEKWRLILKNQSMSYKLAGKEWEEISSSLESRYKQSQKLVSQYDSEDAFQAYLNSLTTAYDPHTNYLSPFRSEDFQIDMSLSLEGIGARLTQQLDYTVVNEIVPGGPAFKSKELYKDDKIIGVAQGDEGEFVDVIGWRLQEVVQMIRGEKGSVVRLQILKKGDINALPDTVRLVRETIKLEDEAARAEMIPITHANTTYKLGVITVPSFYINFEDRNKGVKDYRSTTRDVKRLISELEEQGMDGLMIDLRYNGGGSLQEAIDLTGLFIPRGPVVQVRNVDQSVDQLYDEDGSETYYEGPLAVMTNRYSASASEIFSGAIQDYDRGVILGENTFGKGTVQNLINLDRPVVNYLNRLAAFRKSSNRDASDILTIRDGIQSGDIRMGQLKMTLAKFYRATGSSTQRIGVVPDIIFPSPFDPEAVGESGMENALPWDEISSAKFQPTNQISDEMIDQLYQLYLSDLESDPVLKELNDRVKTAKEDNLDTKVSLNLEVRKAASSPSREVDDMSTTLPEGEVITSEEFKEQLENDAYLREGLKILAELVKQDIG